ncbi:CRNN protein, partial [Arenaria interpres]|nr:CRNN protein [Arenaria interpres]
MAQTKENIHDIGGFYLCAQSDGSCSPLSREELRQLIEQEFEDVMENPQDPKTVKKVLHFLDDDSNRRVDFRELLSLVFRTAKACYKPLQPGQGQEDGQEPTEEEKAAGKQPPEPHTAGRVSHNQRVPKQGVNNQGQDTKTQDSDTSENQEGETPKQDQDTRENQEGETSEEDQDNHENQEGETPKQDQDTHENQEGETPKQDQDNHQTQEGKTKEQDQDNHQDDRTGAPEGDQKRGEILDTANPGQDRYTHKAEETETPKQDPKTHQTKETEATGQDSNHHKSPETESAEKDPNCPSETQGKDPKNKTHVCEASNPDTTQKLLPPQRGTSPCRDPKPQGPHHDPPFHWLPESKVLEPDHSGAEAPSGPAQQHQDTHQHKQPIIDQQVLQSLYQWPPQQ